VEAHRIVAHDYIPSKEDVAHASQNGVMETHFQKGQVPIRLCQVYGQRSERRKWIHLFESVTILVFYSSLRDYDRPQIVDKDWQVCSVPLFLISVPIKVVARVSQIPRALRSTYQLTLVFSNVDRTISDRMHRVQRETSSGTPGLELEAPLISLLISMSRLI